MNGYAVMSWHLSSNHVPAIIDGEAFAFAAIDAVNAGDDGRIIREGSREGRAGDIVESWHLDSWLECDDYGDGFHDGDDADENPYPADNPSTRLAALTTARDAATDPTVREGIADAIALLRGTRVPADTDTDTDTDDPYPYPCRACGEDSGRMLGAFGIPDVPYCRACGEVDYA